MKDNFITCPNSHQTHLFVSNVVFLPSDGAGRSGVYIAIDSNIELCEEDGVFDVYGYLKKIRGLRRGLVETLVSFKALILKSKHE